YSDRGEDIQRHEFAVRAGRDGTPRCVRVRVSGRCVRYGVRTGDSPRADGKDAATTDVEIAPGGGPLALAASDDRLMLAMFGSDGIQTLTTGRALKIISSFKTVAPFSNQYAFTPIL